MVSKRKSNPIFILFLMTCLIYSSLGIAGPTVLGAEAEGSGNAASPQNTFPDVKGHWAENPLKEWIASGLIQGYSDGTLKPDRTVNRGEAFALMNRSFGFYEQAQINFSDVTVSDWEYEEVAKAVKAGYVEGYEGGTIGVKQPISRQEAAVIITRLLGLEGNEESAAANVFTDAKQFPQWSKGAIASVSAAKIMEGYEDGSFKPEALITRAEMIVTLDRALKSKDSTLEKEPLPTNGPGDESSGQGGSQGTGSGVTSPPVTGPVTGTPGGGGNIGGGDGGTTITPVHIVSVSAVNGKINVALDAVPDAVPTIDNFTVHQVINDAAPISVTPSLIAWDPSSKSAALTVPSVSPGEAEQSIRYQVSYHGEAAIESAAFVVWADNGGAGIYVDHVNGSDLNPGTINFPFKTIEKARDTARLSLPNMTEDVIVYLRGGTYPLTHTLKFDQGDSGKNGHNVIYKNYNGETPVISGGKTITGWNLFDGSKNIWEASVDASLETRQIYVNGTRGIRAKSAGGLPGATLTSGGYTTIDTNMQYWGNKSDIEFVYNNLWIEPRVGVASISGTAITMKQPAWDMAFQGGAPLTIKEDGPIPTFIENAYELLDEEGEWYLDRSSRKLYYKPRAGENMDSAEVVAAYLSTLVSGSGNVDNPVHNIQFEGITFAHATWLYPNGNEGYTPIQASVYSKPYASPEYSYDLDNWIVMPANISFSMAKNIRFERNKFIHLGASALGFSNGSQDNVISGNEFTDVSGSAVQIGGVSLNDSYPQDLRYVVKNNQVTNNYIHQIAVEYRGCVGVFVGYTEGTLVSHNEIADLPYTAITMGWGWGDRDFADKPDRISKAEDRWRILYNVPSSSKNNVISHNHIHNIMSYLKDGGGIYNLGAQPGGVIEGNYVHGVNNEYGAIYLDSGSRYLTVANNILHSYVRNFIISFYDNDVEFNYWNADNGYWWEKTGLVANNYKIGNGNVPASILDQVGLEPAYANLLPTSSVNFALGKSVAAYYNDGTPATMQANTEVYQAVDGDPSTIALAANQFAWTMEVDLGNTYLIDRVVTTFMSNPPFFTNLWATDYEIQVSDTGGNGNFTTVKTVTGSAGGQDEQLFTPVNARYVRVVALKPDGPGQTGSQMAIAELAVYGKTAFTPLPLPDRAPAIVPNYNLALGKKAAAYYQDGTIALMQAGAEADKAVDGNSVTTSIAANQYAWTLEVDLGSIYNINRVKTRFAPGLYATEYDIQVSTTGISDSFITVKSVKGSTGDVQEETFVPVNAKYVRIKAIKPAGGNQTGSQMAISEVEVYEYFNYSLNKTATAYNIDGSLAVMQPGHETDKSVDGDTTTGAMAASEYAWMEVVDLEHVFDIERISVIFDENHWPTDFEVAVSTDGVNYNMIDHLTDFTGRAYGYWLSRPVMHVEARYVRVKANKPDGPNQTGTRMQINEISVYASDRVLKMSQKTDNQAGDKYYYRTISNQSFTFEAGDVIEYDVKLNTDDAGIGGIDIRTTDQTVFGNVYWEDQNGITGTPWNDLRANAFGKWYHRELTVPDAMAGKTSSGWMLAFENDSVSKVLQASYDNIVVKRGGNTVLTVYKSGQPQVNVMDRSSHFDTDAPASVVNRN
ncbi:discoidin domain-containing protein [Paenibacillus eucommiae]|uniref:Uncharacterized protein n=1 Tax=Paenibacillus eucommiae TaxID=1355755 RepID=A0ABS4J1F7_9BACL|nr:S-layer homology domain-containing protein [Paenibacillus eucommiae]MBP1993663.1 hypothetical protein [Paenibacillus eucommiae]